MFAEKVKNMPKKYKYAALAGVLVVVALVIALSRGGNDDENIGSEVDLAPPPGEELLTEIENKVAASASSTTSSASVAPTVVVRKPVSVKTPTAPLSATQRYLDAIKIYKTSGYYFQFVECHGLPGSLTLKKGKKFMLDNRDGKARRIAIKGGQSFTIGAYNFAIATAPSKPGTYYITCDGGGAASILVQP